MRYRRLGSSGLRVSEIAIGGWFREEAALGGRTLSDWVSEALERGVNHIDLADIYGRGSIETLYGEILRDYPREHLVISTKCYWPMSQGVNDQGLSRKHLFESLHGSLKRLETDYVDLFMCHADDQETPLEETARAMSDLIRQGKTLYWGVCGWSINRLFELREVCDQINAPRPIVQQLAYNLLERHPEREQLSLCQHLGLGVTAWSPFAGGLLAHGRPLKKREASNLSDRARLADSILIEARHDRPSLIDELRDRAEANSLTMAQLSLAWVLRRPEIASVIVSVSSLEQLMENLDLYQRSVPNELIEQLSSIF